MEEFLRLVDRIADQDFEDVRVVVEKASLNDAALDVVLSITFGDDTSSRWKITCSKPLEHSLKLGFADCLEFRQYHPLLWQFQQQIGSAFFQGAPPEARAAVGALYEAHQRRTHGCIPFDAYFNRVLPLSALLATGNGLLARGPLSLLELYRDVLNVFGTKVYMRFAREAEHWDENEWKPLNGMEVRILNLGTSYVIGTSWSARFEQD